jgi:DNA-binding NarL/FixJ family response regulator
MPTPPSLIVAYPKEIIRAGLRSMLAKTAIKIIGEAADASGTLSLAKKHKPDVLLVDWLMPEADGGELVRSLLEVTPGTAVIALSAFENPDYMARAKVAGASNFLLEDMTAEEFVAAIRNPATASGAFVKIGSRMKGRVNTATAKAKLTREEVELLARISFGLTNEEIGDSFGLPATTIKERVHNLLWKLAVKDRTQAAVWAVRSGVV